MTPYDVQKAYAALDKLKRAKQIRDALSGHMIRAIELDGQIFMDKAKSGTGTITSVGFPDDLRAHLTSSLIAWADQQVSDAESECKKAGVDFVE